MQSLLNWIPFLKEVGSHTLSKKCLTTLQICLAHQKHKGRLCILHSSLPSGDRGQEEGEASWHLKAAQSSFPLCSMSLFLLGKRNILSSSKEHKCKDTSVPSPDLSRAKSASFMRTQKNRIDFRLQTRFKRLACGMSTKTLGKLFFSLPWFFHLIPISSNRVPAHRQTSC